ncbi:MAG: rhodanese-like domain-containing protein [Desulfobulbaceae bacterium]|nr:rhodanese-like domain-containing protein [Desulfobulbaceae bacterium]HIJ77987.1 hypothetical protein [Deltaproteobacteria bacterium]
MSQKKILTFIPLFVFTAFLIGSPGGAITPALAEDAAPMAAQAENVFKGKVVGLSKKAKTISIEVGDKTEMVKFDDETKGLEHALTDHAAIIKFEKRGNAKVATVIKPKLAKLPEGVTEIMTEELAKLIAMGPEKGKYILVDSRPGGRFHEGSIPTAINIPVPKMAETAKSLLPALDKIGDIQLIFYCGGPTCGMSTKNAGMAKKMGYQNVRVLLQGVPGWKKEGNIVVASEKLVKTGNIILVDLRSKQEYENSHIPRAYNIPLSALPDSEDDIPSIKSAPIVVYGSNDAETEKAFKILKKMGAKKGSIWSGGMASWTANGNTIASGPTPDEIAWKREMGKEEVSVADFMNAIEGTAGKIVLDVRNNDEAKSGMFSNAVHIPLDEIEARAAELPKDKEVLVHCTTGARAEMACRALKKAGYQSKFVVANVECEDGKCEISE